MTSVHSVDLCNCSQLTHFHCNTGFPLLRPSFGCAYLLVWCFLSGTSACPWLGQLHKTDISRSDFLIIVKLTPYSTLWLSPYLHYPLQTFLLNLWYIFMLSCFGANADIVTLKPTSWCRVPGVPNPFLTIQFLSGFSHTQTNVLSPSAHCFLPPMHQ